MGGVGCGGAGSVGFWAVLARRFGGIGGGVACETAEPDYIWRCILPKYHHRFLCRMQCCPGGRGRMVNSSAKSWSGEGRWQRKFQGARLHCSEFPLKHSGCFLFLEMVLIFFL